MSWPHVETQGLLMQRHSPLPIERVMMNGPEVLKRFQISSSLECHSLSFRESLQPIEPFF
jgi:hypothetical protein